MRKLIILACLFFSAGWAHGQALRPDGAVITPNNTTLGYYKTDGTVEDSHHATIGYIKKDGTVENSHHATIGYLKADGTLEDSHHATVGHAAGNKIEAALNKFFFSK